MEDKTIESSPSETVTPENSSIQRTRLKKPVKPGVEEHKAAIEQLQQEMQKRRTRLDEIKSLIDQKRQAGGGPEVVKARGKLNDLSSRFKAELEKKKALREELQAVNNHRDSLRTKLRDLKGKVGSYASVQKIEEKIASLDYRVTHHTLDLKEEKRTREEMKKLAGLKPVVGTYAQEEAAFKATESARQHILDRLKACDDQLNGIKSEEEKQRAQMSELRSREAGTSQDLPTLAKERDELREVMNACWQKIQELREEHKVKNNQYWEEQQAWLKQQREERQLKQVAREKEYAEREAARRAAAAEFAGEPYHKEIGLCEQLISHLGKYQQQAQDFAPTATPTSSAGATEVFEGMKAVKKKGDEEEEGFGVFYGTGSKKGKGRKGKGAANSQVTPGDQKLNHSLDIISAFGKLKVGMPSTASKVPEALKEVEERKAYWLKKRAEAMESGMVAGEEPEAATSSKAAKHRADKPKSNGVLDFHAEEWPDFAGNVSKGPTGGPAPASAAAGAPLVSVKLGVVGDRVSVVCSPST